LPLPRLRRLVGSGRWCRLREARPFDALHEPVFDDLTCRRLPLQPPPVQRQHVNHAPTQGLLQWQRVVQDQIVALPDKRLVRQLLHRHSDVAGLPTVARYLIALPCL